MNKPIAIALLIGGVILLAFGISASTSFSSDLSKFFTGSPTDKAIGMVVGGAVAAVAGLIFTLRSGRKI
ncbi:MAG TPA: DUF3185 family protein [Candidatus Limnocylindria bacterium]|nr:DUF3185 family protein [Candidatus Limnocylindria bacterium]